MAGLKSGLFFTQDLDESLFWSAGSPWHIYIKYVSLSLSTRNNNTQAQSVSLLLCFREKEEDLLSRAHTRASGQNRGST